MVTGDRATSGYGQAPGQCRYREPFRLLHDARSARGEIDATRLALADREAELERSRELVAALEASLSWRLTAPLRAAKRRLIGLRR